MTLATGDGLAAKLSPLRARAVRIGSIAGSSGLLFGFSTAVIAGVLDDVTTSYTLTTAQAEFMVAALVAGAFVGASLGGTVALHVLQCCPRGGTSFCAGWSYASRRAVTAHPSQRLSLSLSLSLSLLVEIVVGRISRAHDILRF